jgi:hypothetical protein
MFRIYCRLPVAQRASNFHICAIITVKCIFLLDSPNPPTWCHLVPFQSSDLACKLRRFDLLASQFCSAFICFVCGYLVGCFRVRCLPVTDFSHWHWVLLPVVNLSNYVVFVYLFAQPFRWLSFWLLCHSSLGDVHTRWKFVNSICYWKSGKPHTIWYFFKYCFLVAIRVIYNW